MSNSFIFRVLRLPILLACFMSASMSANAASGAFYKAWLEDINYDGRLDVVLKERVIIVPLGSSSILPLGQNGEPFAFCSESGGGYLPCAAPSSDPSWASEKIRVIRNDLNGDGLLDYILFPVREGVDAFVVMAGQDGAITVAGVIENGQLDDGFSVADRANSLSFSDVNGDGFKDLIVGTPAGAKLVSYISENSGEVTFSGITSTNARNGLALRGEIQAATVPGAFKDYLTVTPTGNATINYPISLPPNVNGDHVPLSLTYTSQARSGGYLSAGWSLSGIPMVSRCAKTLDVEGIQAGYALNGPSPDSYCGQGGKMIPAGPNANFDDDVRYAGGNKNWLDVSRFSIKEFFPDGSHYRYSPYLWRDGGSNSGGVLAWAPLEHVNIYGNKTKYHFKPGGTSSEPDKITYGNTVVDFEYEDYRETTKYVGANGVKISAKNASLLKSIKISNSGILRKTINLGYRSSAVADAPA